MLKRLPRPLVLGGWTHLAVILAFWLWGCSAFQYNPRTQVGLQCPTASVQSLKVPVKDCCGKVIGYEVRAPKMGEAEFVQCRCAEKRTASDYGLPPKLEPFFVPTFRYVEPGPLVLPSVIPAYAERVSQVPIEPLLRPPVRA